jgi:peptidoglycan hydrolase FlgJ
MAVTLSSDLLLDVMRSADPDRVRKAAGRLGNVETKFANATREFLDTVEKVATSGSVRDDLIADIMAASDRVTATDAAARLAGLAKSSPTDASVSRTETAEPFQAFEKMVLRTVFESLLPPAESGVYGGEAASGIWRSLSAEQFANVYGENGGLGIASAMSGSGGQDMLRRWDQWPYFSSGEISGFVT